MAENYRSVMEVQKFFEPLTVLKSACEVSALWMSIGNSAELWRTLMEIEDMTIDEAERAHPKLCYRTTSLARRKNTLVCLAAKHTLNVYDCSAGQIAKTVDFPQISFDNFSAAVFLSYKEVFISGGYAEKTAARVLNFKDGSARRLADMLHPRTYHSCLFLNEFVYAFGGLYVRSTKTAECYDFVSKQWQPLPDMRSARSSFNACSRDKLVYLCGGHISNCETFHIDTEEYRDLGCKLPVANWTVAFIYREELMVISGLRVFYYRDNRWTEKKGRIVLIP